MSISCNCIYIYLNSYAYALYLETMFMCFLKLYMVSILRLHFNILVFFTSIIGTFLALKDFRYSTFMCAIMLYD